MSVNTKSLKRIFALEAERERGLKERNALWAKVAQLKFQVEAMNVENTQVVQEIEKKTNEIDLLKAELDRHRTNTLRCVNKWEDMKTDRDLWKSKAEKLVEVVRKQADKWFDPKLTEYACGHYAGGLHGIPKNEEFHDVVYCHRIMKEALAEYEASK